MKIKVQEVAYHRNGICGEPFQVVKFLDGPKMMLGVVFDEPRHVAVFDLELLGKGVIEFGANSFRGDRFEDDLREGIKEDNSYMDLKVGEIVLEGDEFLDEDGDWKPVPSTWFNEVNEQGDKVRRKWGKE